LYARKSTCTRVSHARHHASRYITIEPGRYVFISTFSKLVDRCDESPKCTAHARTGTENIRDSYDSVTRVRFPPHALHYFAHAISRDNETPKIYTFPRGGGVFRDDSQIQILHGNRSESVENTSNTLQR